MSGHSKWATIKRKKAKIDAQRGKVFTRLIKELMVSARQGGGDESSNARLRTAVAAAKAANMPTANIERAIKRGTGELDGVNYEEVTYEGYGPSGVAFIIEVVTDNRNRTVADMRHYLSKHGGNLGESGCVSWMFEKKGLIVIPAAGIEEDELMLLALDAGADDLKQEEESFEITTPPENFETVKEALEGKGLTIESAEVSMIPKTTIKLQGTQAEKVMRLVDLLEEHDDVQNVYANFDIDMDEMPD